MINAAPLKSEIRRDSLTRKSSDLVSSYIVTDPIYREGVATDLEINQTPSPNSFVKVNSSRTTGLSSMRGINFEPDTKMQKYSFESISSFHKTINYEFKNKVIGTIPKQLSYLLLEIENSKYMLDFKDNWDEEGSKKYEETVWVSAVGFLLNYAKTLFYDRAIEIKSPKIYHGPKGSIDIIWDGITSRMVINISKDGKEGMFYADNYKDQFIEGSFKTKQFNSFLLPIAVHI